MHGIVHDPHCMLCLVCYTCTDSYHAIVVHGLSYSGELLALSTFSSMAFSILTKILYNKPSLKGKQNTVPWTGYCVGQTLFEDESQYIGKYVYVCMRYTSYRA